MSECGRKQLKYIYYVYIVLFKNIRSYQIKLDPPAGTKHPPVGRSMIREPDNIYK